MEVKRRAIQIALEMVSSRNVEDVVLFLKKQLQGTMDQEFDKVEVFTAVFTNFRISNTGSYSSNQSTRARSNSPKSLPMSSTY
jgi:hypothetical protein